MARRLPRETPDNSFKPTFLRGAAQFGRWSPEIHSMQALPSIDQFLSCQQSGVLADFRDGGTLCLIATTPERLVRHSKEYGWSVSSLSGIRRTSALVIQKPRSEPELWVRARYRGYRKAFRRFLDQYYGFDAAEIPRILQVDHLHPSSRFTPENEHYFVRLALVDRGLNASYGAGFERLLYDRERERELIGGVHMDWMAYLKTRNIRLPAKAGGVESWSVWAWQCAKSLAPEGFDVILTYVGLTTMLNLAFQDTWRPLPLHESFKAEAEAHPSYVCAPLLAEA